MSRIAGEHLLAVQFLAAPKRAGRWFPVIGGARGEGVREDLETCAHRAVSPMPSRRRVRPVSGSS